MVVSEANGRLEDKMTQVGYEAWINGDASVLKLIFITPCKAVSLFRTVWIQEKIPFSKAIIQQFSTLHVIY